MNFSTFAPDLVKSVTVFKLPIEMNDIKVLNKKLLGSLIIVHYFWRASAVRLAAGSLH